MNAPIRKKATKFSSKDIVIVGFMASIVFVFTYFLGIQIFLPTGPVMLKTANVICLLSGIMFGGLRGGLSAGIGSALFDLAYPGYAPYALTTLVLFFIMGGVAGLVAHYGNPKTLTRARIIFASTCGALSYYLIYMIRSIGGLMITGSSLQAAVVANIPKLSISAFNCIFAIVVTSIFAPILHKRVKGILF